MADIELMIKIPEEDYEDILNGETKASALNWSTFNAIRNGTPLPKGHGDLIDKNELIKKYKKDCGRRIYADNFIFDVEYNSTTIIKADRADKEEI